MKNFKKDYIILILINILIPILASGISILIDEGIHKQDFFYMLYVFNNIGLGGETFLLLIPILFLKLFMSFLISNFIANRGKLYTTVIIVNIILCLIGYLVFGISLSV